VIIRDKVTIKDQMILEFWLFSGVFLEFFSWSVGYFLEFVLANSACVHQIWPLVLCACAILQSKLCKVAYLFSPKGLKHKKLQINRLFWDQSFFLWTGTPKTDSCV
jgi:hypothetical protein